MATGYVLYNNLAGNEADRQTVSRLETRLHTPLTLIDITRITSYPVFFRGMEPEDVVIVSGGDGTLNRFVNDIQGIDIPCDIQYFPNGTQNQFARSMGKEKGCLPFSIKQEISNLPMVIAEGKEYRFLHAVDLGERKRAARAVVTVDGEAHTYQKVRLASAMWGKQLCVMLYHHAGRFWTWFLRRDVCSSRRKVVLCGQEITVKWEFPCSLLIDGETVPQVSSYTVRVGGAVC